MVTSTQGHPPMAAFPRKLASWPPGVTSCPTLASTLGSQTSSFTLALKSTPTTTTAQGS